jgi:hypothetical protein
MDRLYSYSDAAVVAVAAAASSQNNNNNNNENTSSSISVIKNELNRKDQIVTGSASGNNDHLYKAYPIVPIIPNKLNPCPPYHFVNTPNEKHKNSMKAEPVYCRNLTSKTFRLSNESSFSSKPALNYFHKKFALGKRKYLEVKRASSLKKRVSFLRSKLKSSSSKMDFARETSKSYGGRGGCSHGEPIFFDSEGAVRLSSRNLATANLSSSNLNVNESPSLPVSFQQQSCQVMNQFFLVEIRAVILRVNDIDTLHEKFYAEAFVEARWVDYSLRPTIRYDADVHWNPKLCILNSVGEVASQIWYSQSPVMSEIISRNLAATVEPGNSNEKSRSGDKSSASVNNFKESEGSVICERWRISGQFWQT